MDKADIFWAEGDVKLILVIPPTTHIRACWTASLRLPSFHFPFENKDINGPRWPYQRDGIPRRVCFKFLLRISRSFYKILTLGQILCGQQTFQEEMDMVSAVQKRMTGTSMMQIQYGVLRWRNPEEITKHQLGGGRALGRRPERFVALNKVVFSAIFLCPATIPLPPARGLSRRSVP